MDFFYIIVIVLHAQAGADRVAVTAPGHYETLAQCEAQFAGIEEHPYNKRLGIINVRCVAVPDGSASK